MNRFDLEQLGRDAEMLFEYGPRAIQQLMEEVGREAGCAVTIAEILDGWRRDIQRAAYLQPKPCRKFRLSRYADRSQSSDRRCASRLNATSRPGDNMMIEDLSNLPVRVNRRQAAEIVTQHFFKTSDRTLERWPNLDVIHVNRQAMVTTKTLVAEACRRVALAIAERDGT